jgi:ribosomal protein L40E
MGDEARCRSCGALLAPEATWCGQCYAPVTEPEPDLPPPPQATTAAPAPAAGATPFWPCIVCEARNPIEVDVCGTCGTPFAQMMRDEPARREVDPREAVRRSLLFPGLGHRLAGYPAEGFARAALFVVSAGMAVLVGIAGASSGVATLMFWLFVASAVAAYAGSAVEAGRIARGEPLLVAGRVLMWVVTGEVLLAVVVLAISVVSATRR